ncbi:MAG: IS1595 family transposase [Sphaerochaeta sp.]|nr:IS1595 family transposase [Sphaerochaeta sp.]
MKKPKLSKEALEAYKALLKLSEEEQQLVFRKVSQPEPAETVQEQPKEKGNCPHCGSSHVSRYGKTSLGYQRFICVDCSKTFAEKGRPVWIGSHFPKKIWIEYIRLMNMGATLKDLAEALDINVTTAFYWRHKILTALKDGKSDAVLEEHTQADETFTYLNTKGNKNASNNLHRYEPTSRDSDYKSVRKSGHRHGRGSCSSTRGLNQGFVCTPLAIGGNEICWGRPSNMGAPSSDDLDSVYTGHLGETVILITDASRAAGKYAQDKELPIIQLKSETESRQGKYNLQKVNKLHSAFKQDLARFNGVSTKYLENYANMTIFKQETPSISGIARATLLVEKLSNVPRVARWKDLRGTDYPPFVYEVLDKDEPSKNEVST